MLGITQVIYETDCQVVQQVTEGTMQDPIEFGTIIKKGRSLLVGQPHMNLVFVWRSGNTVCSCIGTTIDSLG
ncbi:hypothetical protein LINPERPRIM_LOCUS13985 [Linum perenne]